ncbi:MAG TPA: tetraacyldisaccharide 4'-kinase [Thermoanaerobaculia bacterium]|nr:tetraacyldisaccharide 4'-kinase [Thermoanaerobaculia bacterium]
MNPYGAVVAARRRLYESGWLRSERIGVPVVSVGNLTWGGTGKTPLLAYLAARFEASGRRVGIVARGYRRRSSGVVVVSDGSRLLASASEGGDEPYLLASRLPRAVVVVAERRPEGAREAVRRGAEILLLDDAFQHLAIARDADVVLVDAADPWGGGLPPAGRARERPAALSRADVVVVTRAVPGSASRADAEVRRVTPAPIFHCRFRFAGWFSNGKEADRPVAPGLGFCAVGNPASFRETLAEAGANVADFAAFRDHHDYSDADVRKLEKRAARAGASVLLTTEKDAVKIAGPTRIPLLAARIEAEIFEPGLPERIGEIIAGRPR